MEKLKNLSIRKTIVLYLVIGLVAGFLGGALAMKVAEDAQQQIFYKYIDQEKYWDATYKQERNYEVKVAHVDKSDMTKQDNILSEVCDFFQTYSILVFSMSNMIAAVILFYRHKIAVPLAELAAASEMIGKNKLDFKITYTNRDELGRLCMEFEKMRKSLEVNNRRMWKTIEEEKALRAAIAHDMRSPLAVFRGYQEMLLEFVPEEQLDKEQIVEMLRAGMKQIERMEHFIESMRTLSRLEDRVMDYKEISLGSLAEQIAEIIRIYERDSGKKGTIVSAASGQLLCLDKEVVLEVADNLLANAFRYAVHEVHVELETEGEELQIVVSDDGDGFKEDIDKVAEAYYHSNPQDDLQHFGLGMYICRIYCEVHGGKLLVGNLKSGGAIVKALFSTTMQENS